MLREALVFQKKSLCRHKHALLVNCSICISLVIINEFVQRNSSTGCGNL